MTYRELNDLLKNIYFLEYECNRVENELIDRNADWLIDSIKSLYAHKLPLIENDHLSEVRETLNRSDILTRFLEEELKDLGQQIAFDGLTASGEEKWKHVSMKKQPTMWSRFVKSIGL